jgi:hypothetical protein
MVPRRFFDYLGMASRHVELTAHGSTAGDIAARLTDDAGGTLLEIREPAARTREGSRWGQEAAFRADVRRFVAEENRRRRWRGEPAIRRIVPLRGGQPAGESEDVAEAGESPTEHA